ncbi:cell wall hydrolase [Novosphingobium kaempferiae]|uniref:cell wall hydrolase n=1 Tax=Novosphingobium kaempferiae TaxID=2896849 RepID=UPI001E52EADF|nr:cell wall hydrolase [Novosphingobium kaempferiae]
MKTISIYFSHLTFAREFAVLYHAPVSATHIGLIPMHWRRWTAAALLAIAFYPVQSAIPQRYPTEEVLDASKLPDVAYMEEADTPSIKPSVFTSIPQRDAHTLNDEAPFAPLGSDLPAPFVIPSQGADYARALDCLASAILYEAGDDRTGQAAVAQVVLNRVRHPAFPHSVCGVVYQGTDRTTGCQFTFTCDGALRRRPSPAQWHRARQTASAFLAGERYPDVGMATHYHTDWVHPYWSTSLDKIARTGPHLFFRWRGHWGRRSAFSATYAGGEEVEPKLAFLSIAHRLHVATEPSVPALPAPPELADKPRITKMRAGDHFISIEGGGDGSDLAVQSLGECQGQSYCKVVAWDRRSLAYGSPQDPVIRSVAFLYVRDKRTGVEIVLWDCTRFNRPTEVQCLSGSNLRWITFQGDLSRAS